MIEVAITVPWHREIHFDHDQAMITLITCAAILSRRDDL